VARSFGKVKRGGKLVAGLSDCVIGNNGGEFLPLFVEIYVYGLKRQAIQTGGE
jgi:hypothetical protein